MAIDYPLFVGYRTDEAEPLTYNEPMTAFFQPEMPVDDWNALFEAITERLLRAVEEPELGALSPAPGPHDIVSSVQSQVRECVSDLRTLHSGLRDRRARHSKEEERADAHAFLRLALADFAETTGFDLSAVSRFDSTHPASLDPSAWPVPSPSSFQPA